MKRSYTIHLDPLAPIPVKFAVKNLLPWPKVQTAIAHGYDNFTAHHRALEMCVASYNFV